MGIKPLEKDKHFKSLYIKIGLIAFLIIGVIVYSVLKKPELNNQDKKEVLGEKTEKQDESSKEQKTSIIFTLEKQGDILGENTAKNTEGAIERVVEQTKEIVTETVSNTKETVSEFIIENTVIKLVEQIKELPEEQREQIIIKICEEYCK